MEREREWCFDPAGVGWLVGSGSEWEDSCPGGWRSGGCDVVEEAGRG